MDEIIKEVKVFCRKYICKGESPIQPPPQV